MYELWAVVLTAFLGVVTGGITGWFALRAKRQDVGSELINQLHMLFQKSEEAHEQCRNKLAYVERKMIRHERRIADMEASCPRYRGKECLPVVIE